MCPALMSRISGRRSYPPALTPLCAGRMLHHLGGALGAPRIDGEHPAATSW